MNETSNQTIGHESKPEAHFTSDSRQPQRPSNLLLILMVLLLVGLVGYGGYYFGKYYSAPVARQIVPSPLAIPVNPTPVAPIDPTARWKTYTNSLLGIEFKYPSDWSEEKIDENNLRLVSPDVLKEAGASPTNGAMIDISFRKIRETVDQLYDRVKDGNDAGGPLVFNKTKTSFQGKPTVTFEEKSALLENSLTKVTAVITESGIYTIRLQTFDKEQTERQMLDQILSTFKFVDSTTQTPTSTLTTYTNAVYGYSISFPTTWHTTNVAAGGGNSAALPNSLIVDINDGTQVSRPYPNGVITIQGFGATPSYDSSWTKTNATINGANPAVYFNPNGLDGPSTMYLFQNTNGQYIEILFRSSKEDTIYQVFNQIISTFKLTN